MRALFFIGTTLFFCLTNGSLAQDSSKQIKNSRSLSLQEVLKASTTYHPALLASYADIDAAQGETLSAEGAFDRALKGEFVHYGAGKYTGSYYDFRVEQPLETWGSKFVGGFRQGNGSFPVYDDYYETNSQGEVRLGAEIPLARDRATDKRRVTIGKAKISQEQMNLLFLQRKIELIRSARNAYWEWAAARAKRDVFKQLLKVATERVTQLEKRDHAGDIASFDKIDNDRLLFQRESQLLAAERMLRKAEFELSLFYRDAQSQPLSIEYKTLPPEINFYAPPPAHTIGLISIEKAYAQRPEVKRLDFLIQQQQLELGLSENDLLPRVDIKSYFSQEYGDYNDSREDVELKLGLVAEFPLQTRNQEGRKILFSSKIRELHAQALALRNRIEVEVNDSSNAISIAQQRVSVALKELLTARKLEEGERTKFLHGDSNLIFVNLREQTTADAAVRVIDSLLEYHKAVAQCDAALGNAHI